MLARTEARKRGLKKSARSQVGRARVAAASPVPVSGSSQRRHESTGIGNRPLDEELQRQAMLPPRGRRKKGQGSRISLSNRHPPVAWPG
jgi:hypothetical protein